ncbi:hypothetical protein [Nitrosomonas sp.]|uniref:hypothetical protein n=1 Tax=Nitrosomonas sp. TaxID=42353 RepID=UPI00260CA532|nr:hypothetical protein [Nitrosomonas sp.]
MFPLPALLATGESTVGKDCAIRKLRESRCLPRIEPNKGGDWQVLDDNDKEPY